MQNFGEPFFLVIREGETLAEVKGRIQKKLQVPDDEFSKVPLYVASFNYQIRFLIKFYYCFLFLWFNPFFIIIQWKFAFLSLGRPEYLQDSDIISSRFQVRTMNHS